jgi:hypothetical protein
MGSCSQGSKEGKLMGIFTKKEEDGSRTGRLSGRQVFPNDKQRQREIDQRDAAAEDRKKGK